MLVIKVVRLKTGVKVFHNRYGFGKVIDDSRDPALRGEALVEFERGTDKPDITSGDGVWANWSRYCKSDLVKITDLIAA